MAGCTLREEEEACSNHRLDEEIEEEECVAGEVRSPADVHPIAIDTALIDETWNRCLFVP